VRGPAALTVTLGDYIDRGPQSAGVIERLSGNPFPTPYVALKGNHEAIMLGFLATPLDGELWAGNGAVETLRSYDSAAGQAMAVGDYVTAQQLLNDALPQTDHDFLLSLKTSHSFGRYFFCHAGVRPGVPLERQSDDDLIWMREPFLSSTADFGKIVVHGHTPQPAPDVRDNRINIDTGAWYSNRLTCIALDGDGHRFLDV
jgi:serine/threonine protein phosphatase 1